MEGAHDNASAFIEKRKQMTIANLLSKPSCVICLKFK